jgi:hypothetical protein
VHQDGFLDDPRAIWNLDESAFTLGEKHSKVYARKGTREVRSYYDGRAKESLTLLVCGNASGIMSRPFILYDGKVNLRSRLEGTHDQIVTGTNRSGYMDTSMFTLYVLQELIPKIEGQKVSIL